MPLRILHIINVPKYNAVAWYGVVTALAQKQAGHEIFIAADPGSPSPIEAEKQGLTHHFVGNFSNPNPFTQWVTALRLRRFIKDHRIDVVNAHQGNGYYAIVWAVLGMKNRPLLVRTRGDIRWPKNNFFNRKLYADWSDGIIAVADVTYKRMTETFSIPQDQIETILPSVDTLFFRRIETNEEGGEGSELFPVFGLIGRIDKKKGHLIALAAFKKLVDKGYNVRMVVAGKEADLPYETLKNFARENRLAQRIFFLGPVNDIRDVIRICDCGVVASTESEAICRVALEFMAMRVPVIASRLHGIPDVVKEGQGGFLFETGNVEALSESMEKFLLSRKEWRSVKSAARNAVEDAHKLSRLADESVAFYRRLLDKNGLRR